MNPLTKDDFIISTLYHIETNETKMEQILKNQKDAEKYSERRCDICGHTLSHCCCSNEKRKAVRENIQIVESLKKRIKFIDSIPEQIGKDHRWNNKELVEELQKILGEKR